MNIQTAKHERGIALLFAIGILALLLVLALGFATNSIQEQKVAYNNNNRSQAQLIARSAVNRIQAYLFYRQKNAPFGSGDFLQSILSTTDTAEHYSDASSTDKPTFTGSARKKAEMERLLDLTLDDWDAQSKDDWELDEYPNLGWTYIYDRGDDGKDRRIIGRYAFRVVDRHNKFDAAAVTPTLTTDRIGISPRELRAPFALAGTPNSPFRRWLNAEHYIADRNPSAADRRKVRRQYEFSSRPHPEAFWADAADADTKFDDSEAKNHFYHRFQLNRSADSRDDVTGWEALTVENLLAEPTRYYADERGSVNLVANGGNPQVDDALPFLRQIGTDKKNYKDLATRRKQVAANFLDYNRKLDLPPTSDVDPATWQNRLTTAPTYSGNKRTPYLNELNFKLDVSITVKRNLTRTDTTINPPKNYYHYVVTATVNLSEVKAELLNLYDDSLVSKDWTVRVYFNENSKITLTRTLEGTSPETSDFKLPDYLDLTVGSSGLKKYLIAEAATTDLTLADGSSYNWTSPEAEELPELTLTAQTAVDCGIAQAVMFKSGAPASAYDAVFELKKPFSETGKSTIPGTT